MENNYIDIKNKLDEGLTFKISRFKEQIKKTKPHKHDEYYELIFLNDGEGFHCIEFEKYMVSTPEFYFLKGRSFLFPLQPLRSNGFRQNPGRFCFRIRPEGF